MNSKRATFRLCSMPFILILFGVWVLSWTPTPALATLQSGAHRLTQGEYDEIKDLFRSSQRTKRPLPGACSIDYVTSWPENPDWLRVVLVSGKADGFKKHEFYVERTRANSYSREVLPDGSILISLSHRFTGREEPQWWGGDGKKTYSSRYNLALTLTPKGRIRRLDFAQENSRSAGRSMVSKVTCADASERRITREDTREMTPEESALLVNIFRDAIKTADQNNPAGNATTSAVDGLWLSLTPACDFRPDLEPNTDGFHPMVRRSNSPRPLSQLTIPKTILAFERKRHDKSGFEVRITSVEFADTGSGSARGTEGNIKVFRLFFGPDQHMVGFWVQVYEGLEPIEGRPETRSAGCL